MLTCIEPIGLQVTSIETPVQPGLFEVQRGPCMDVLVELRALKADVDANKEIEVLKKLSKKSNFS